MNLTLSLGIDGGAAEKKRKVRDGEDGGGGAMRAVDGGERGRVGRVLQARDRMVKEEFDDVARLSPDGGGGGGGLQLMHLLLSAVAAGEAGDVHAAAAALQEVYRHASFRGGDPVQRVAAYFADALASRLLQSPVASPQTTRAEQFLAFTMFYQASLFYQFAHFTANQAIVEAFEAGGRRRLHVVDFDVSYGFQWPSLIQSLSDAATSSSHDGSDCDEAAVSLRITGFGTNADELRETEARLARFASGCPNVRFEFEGTLNGPNSHHDRIKMDAAATVVVNLVFPATAQNATTSSREASNTLAYIHSLNPSLVFLIEKDQGGGSNLTRGNNASRRSVSFLPRFAANLRYFAAVFDSLDECLPVESAERLAIERNHLGREIINAMASLDHRGGDHMASEASWKETMESAGFEGVRLSSRTASQAKLLLKMKSGCGGSGGGFRVIEGDDGRAMSLGWRDMTLITASGWRPCRRSINKSDL